MFWGGVGLASYCFGGLKALGVSAVIFAIVQALP